MKTNVILQL